MQIAYEEVGGSVQSVGSFHSTVLMHIRSALALPHVLSADALLRLIYAQTLNVYTEDILDRYMPNKGLLLSSNAAPNATPCREPLTLNALLPPEHDTPQLNQSTATIE